MKKFGFWFENLKNSAKGFLKKMIFARKLQTENNENLLVGPFKKYLHF
jgi:uncharacterized protein HemX